MFWLCPLPCLKSLCVCVFIYFFKSAWSPYIWRWHVAVAHTGIALAQLQPAEQFIWIDQKKKKIITGKCIYICALIAAIPKLKQAVTRQIVMMPDWFRRIKAVKQNAGVFNFLPAGFSILLFPACRLSCSARPLRHSCLLPCWNRLLLSVRQVSFFSESSADFSSCYSLIYAVLFVSG